MEWNGGSYLFVSRLPSLNFYGHNKGLLNKIDTDFYTGKYIKRKDRSIEHIIPRSKGGKNDLFNYAVTHKDLNNQRGNMDMKQWLQIHPEFLENMQKFARKYFDRIINGRRYGEGISKTIDRVTK